MPCRRCGKKKVRFKKAVENARIEGANPSKKRLNKAERIAARAKRIEARNKRMAARNARAIELRKFKENNEG